MSTIAAISTPAGPGGISVIRISGDNAINIAAKVFSFKNGKVSDLKSNYLQLGKIQGSDFNEQAFCVVFRAPHSFTGEDLVEFQCHSGYAAPYAVLELVLKNGAVPADKGEFTRRAFLNGKLKLADAEGIADMINADSRAALSAASRLMSGELSKKTGSLQTILLDLISNMEASLDYPEEMEDEIRTDGLKILKHIKPQLERLIATGNRGRMLKRGITVAIIGLPNSGKSSLLNTIARDERAIVTEIEGTTRDVIEQSVIYKGQKLNILDTAGIRITKDIIEIKGIEKSEQAANSADIIIILLDGSKEISGVELIEKYKSKPHIVCINKSDILKLKIEDSELKEAVVISAKTGDGIDNLLDRILEMTVGMSTDGEVITSERHYDALKRALTGFNSAIENYSDVYTDCVLVDLKAAYQALGEITGSTANEEIIASIFGRFCVGK